MFMSPLERAQGGPHLRAWWYSLEHQRTGFSPASAQRHAVSCLHAGLTVAHAGGVKGARAQAAQARSGSPLRAHMVKRMLLFSLHPEICRDPLDLTRAKLRNEPLIVAGG